MLLLAAAGLKLFALGGGSAVPELGWFAQPWVQLLVAEWELLLGAWLLSGLHARVSWLAALITFGTFAVVSGYLGWVGVASCGCLGAVHTNPWWVFGVDVTAVVLLAVSRSDVTVIGTHFERTVGAWVASVAVVCGALLVVGSLVFGSVEVVFAKLRGRALSVPAHVDFGPVTLGEQRETTATVSNWTGEPIRLLGGTVDCTCATTDDFPLVIPPNGSASFRIRMRAVGDTGGQLTRTVTVRTDHPRHPQVAFQIGCRVVP